MREPSWFEAGFGIMLMAVGVGCFVAALATKDWRWLLGTGASVTMLAMKQ